MTRKRRSPASALPPPLRGVVFVTGASGATGRRVVRTLLAAGARVRALTRSPERLTSALATVGVDARAEETAGRLDIIVSDLFNLRDEFFDGVTGVASCSGTRIGPTDDPDRKKYYQGKVYYPPIVQEDTPENVEFVGVRNLAQFAMKHFEAARTDGTDVLEFRDPAAVRTTWGQVDDVVMGGVSQSNITVQDGSLVFSGFVSTDNFGGFASARTVDFDNPLDLSEFDGVQLRVRGDGKSYKFIVRCEKKWDGICHCFTFPTRSGEWTNVTIPFSAFNTVFRAKTMPAGKALDKTNIVALQLMLSKFEYDGDLNPNFSPGPFELRISSIQAYKESAEPEYPKLVHCGSAAVTRLLRKDEFTEDMLPKIVQMNDVLGRLLEWKFAGEDTIRETSIPYCILRPCGLTEEEPVGVDSLDFQQGDFKTGLVSRDDIANVFLEAFSNPALVNVTTEIAQKTEGSTDLEPTKDRLSKLSRDAESSRKYAPFPFVPVAKVESNS